MDTGNATIADGRPFMIGPLARVVGLESWQLRKLAEKGLIPEADRIGRYRVYTTADLPAIAAGLRAAGFVVEADRLAAVAGGASLTQANLDGTVDAVNENGQARPGLPVRSGRSRVGSNPPEYQGTNHVQDGVPPCPNES